MVINNPGLKPEETQKESQTSKQIAKGGFLNILLGLVLVLVIAGGTLMFFQKGQVLAQTNQLDTEIGALNTEMNNLKDNKVEVSKNATDALTRIQADELRWSEVIAAVNQLLPIDTSGKRKIKVMSYAGSGEGKIAVNMATEPAALAPYADVSQLISAFNNNVFFKNAYVPSISRGTNVDGTITLSFVLNVNYQKAETGSEGLNLNAGADKVKVPVNPNK